MHHIRIRTEPKYAKLPSALSHICQSICTSRLKLQDYLYFKIKLDFSQGFHEVYKNRRLLVNFFFFLPTTQKFDDVELFKAGFLFIYLFIYLVIYFLGFGHATYHPLWAPLVSHLRTVGTMHAMWLPSFIASFCFLCICASMCYLLSDT